MPSDNSGIDLPLTDLHFSVLLALKGETLHGYALVKRLRELPGRDSLRTGTVYAALARLEEAGRVEEADRTPGPDEDERRRYYRLTPYGLEVARAEAARLSTVLGMAREKDVLPDGAEA